MYLNCRELILKFFIIALMYFSNEINIFHILACFKFIVGCVLYQQFMDIDVVFGIMLDVLYVMFKTEDEEAPHFSWVST